MKIIKLALAGIVVVELIGCAGQMSSPATQQIHTYGIRQTGSEQGGKYVFCYDCPVHTPKTAVSATAPDLGTPFPINNTSSAKPVERSVITPLLPLPLPQQAPKVDETKPVTNGTTNNRSPEAPVEMQKPEDKAVKPSSAPVSGVSIDQNFFQLEREGTNLQG